MSEFDESLDQTLDKKKRELEVEKIESEISNLKRKWYQKPEYIIPSVATVMATLITASVLWTNGAFDFRVKEAAFKLEKLEYESRKFQDKKDSLNIDLQKLKIVYGKISSEKDSLVDQIGDLKKTKEEYESLIERLKSDSRISKTEINNLFSQIRSLEQKIKDTGRLAFFSAEMQKAAYYQILNKDYGIRKMQLEVPLENEKQKNMALSRDVKNLVGDTIALGSRIRSQQSTIQELMKLLKDCQKSNNKN